MPGSKNVKLEQLVRRIDARWKLLRAWALQGGSSAQVTALEVLLADSQRKKMIVRQHGDANLKQNPRVASNEFKLLQILHAAGLPVPAPYDYDESNEVLPTPYIVIEFIEGHTVNTPSNLSNCISQLAACLANIHSVECSKLDLSFLPKQEDVYGKMISKRPLHLDATFDEGRIRDTLEPVWPLPQRNKDVILHGDFWPGNTLWRDEQLVAVIDWEDAALGDPLADLANGRLEIAWAFGIDAMNDFTRQYKSKMTILDFTNLPYWDLCAALRPIAMIPNWGLDESTKKRMRERHSLFVSQAFEKLSIQ